MTNTAEGTAHDDLWRTLQIVSEWIRVADTKAGAALAVDGAVLALTATRLQGDPSPQLPAILALSMAIALAAASVLSAIWTVVPRARRLRTNSITHYGTIAAFTSPASYHTVALETLTDPESLTKNLTQHIWTFSRAAARKYVLVTWAINLLAGGMLAGTIGLLLP
jgi:drug/metabolite transporter (DMT)-like permease